MLRVTTLYAALGGGDGAVLHALSDPGRWARSPGVWSGRQAAGLGLVGEVTTEALRGVARGP